VFLMQTFFLNFLIGLIHIESIVHFLTGYLSFFSCTSVIRV